MGNINSQNVYFKETEIEPVKRTPARGLLINKKKLQKVPEFKAGDQKKM